MIDRRSIILAGAAAPILASIGIEARASEIGDSYQPIMQNVRNNNDLYLKYASADRRQKAEDVVAITAVINSVLIRRHGRVLFPDASRVMGAPVCRFGDHFVCAKAQKVKSRIVLDQNGNFNLTEFVDSVYVEFISNDEHKKWHPYVPLTTSGVVVDPTDGERVLDFMTRYGTSTDNDVA